MVECARCGRDVDDLQLLSPDAITEELLDTVDHGKEDLAGEGGIEVCAECMDELKED